MKYTPWTVRKTKEKILRETAIYPSTKIITEIKKKTIKILRTRTENTEV